MFANAEAIDAGLFRDHRLLDDVAQHVRVRVQLAGGVARDVAEGVEAKFKCHAPTV